tara:strand:+ start:51174 stop:51599 length:426 start_codon:yes stop_codon:yes gene_type:complete
MADDDVKADDILGYWLTEEKTGVIHIQKGDDNRYFGEIVWVKDIHTGKAKERLDKENPDEKLRSRSILGLKNTWGFKFDGDDEWVDGSIYDPKSGKTYSAKMELDDRDELELRGYVGVPLFGKTTEWTREKSKVPAYMQKK